MEISTTVLQQQQEIQYYSTTAISTAQQRSSMKVSNQSGPPQHESIQSKWSSTTQIHGSKIKSIEVNLTKLNLVVQQSCL